METPKIRYNVRDRGRKHTGQVRNFDLKKLCDAINGDHCQETVESGGMLGYFGHLPRVRYGMHPVEGGIENGKYAPVEPAIVTTYLRASPDGTIEHKARFLGTQSGQLARKLWEEKIGGFSSAIDTGRYEFYGFDYVNAPNFLQNSFRGVVLDDVTAQNPLGMTYDDIFAAELAEKDAGFAAVLDAVTRQRDYANSCIENLRAENEELLSKLATMGVTPTFDAIKPTLIPRGRARIAIDDAHFRNAELPAIIEETGKRAPAMPNAYKYLAERK